MLSLNLELGTSYIDYSETRENQPSRDAMFTEITGLGSIGLNLKLFPNWLYFRSEVGYSGPKFVSSDSSFEVTFLRNNNEAVIRIPGRPGNLLFHSEYYINQINTNNTSFGYKQLSGIRYSVGVEFTSKSGFFNFWLKYPFWNQIANRSEFYLGAKFFFGPGATKDEPFPFKEGMSINFEYWFESLEIKGERKIEIEVSSMVLSIGFTW